MSDTPKSAAQRVEEAVGFRVDDLLHKGIGRVPTFSDASEHDTDADARHLALQTVAISECERADRAEAALTACFAAQCKWCRESQTNLKQRGELWEHCNSEGTWYRYCQASHLGYSELSVVHSYHTS